jgi:long-chain acyl-CoA synthetase
MQNIMKLAQGEYVALEKIENLYSGSPVVAQIYVHGDSLQSYLLAVIIPDLVQLAAAVSSVTGARVKPDDFEKLVKACKDERVNEHILATLTKEAQRNGLKGYASQFACAEKFGNSVG